MKNIEIFLVVVLLSALCVPAKGQHVSGKVVDAKSGEAVGFASVVWAGTTTGVSADANGHFSIAAGSGKGKLVVSSMGYRRDTIEVGGGDKIEVRLRPMPTTLKSVNIRGRQHAREVDLNKLEASEMITTEGLRGLACCNLGESFENSVTVDVGYSDAVSGSKQIQLLGLNGTYSQMLLENTPFMGGLSTPQGLGFVPGQWLDGISISKGVATVKNGYEAITGTINLDYDKPQKGNQFDLNVFANGDMKTEITAKVKHQFSDYLSAGLLLYATNNWNKVDHLGHDGYMDFPMQRQVNVAGRLNYDKPGGLCSQTLVNYIDEHRVGGSMNYKEGARFREYLDSMLMFSPVFDTTAHWGFVSDVKRLHFFSKNGFAIDKYSSFGSQVGGTSYENVSSYSNANYSGKENSLFVNLLYNSLVWGGHEVDGGVSFRYNYTSEVLRAMAYSGASLFCTLPYSDINTDFLRTEVVPGAFGQFTFHHGTYFTGTLGLRYDYNSAYGRHLITPRFHFRWEPIEKLVLRGTAGKGYRSANPIAENIGVLASSREIVRNPLDPLRMEEAWNMGLNLTRKFKILDNRDLTVTADYYYTNFVNQVVVDYDLNPNLAVFSNLEGRSYSSVTQVDITAEWLEGFETTLAGKINDVKCTYHGVLMDKPYTSRYKGLLVLSYHTRFNKWRFDYTTQLNGPQRVPLNVGEVQGMTHPYIYMLCQMTRRFKHFEVYGGVENITNYTQSCLVINGDQPFTSQFDASVAYAPLMGRLFYLGLRTWIK